MQAQERGGGLSVPLVAWTDREGGPGHLSAPGLSHRPFPTLAAHPRFTGESCCEAISILLLVSVPLWGNGEPSPAPLLAQTPAQLRAGLSVKPHVGHGWGQGRGSVLGEAAIVGGSWDSLATAVTHIRCWAASQTSPNSPDSLLCFHSHRQSSSP